MQRLRGVSSVFKEKEEEKERDKDADSDATREKTWERGHSARRNYPRAGVENLTASISIKKRILDQNREIEGKAHGRYFLMTYL